MCKLILFLLLSISCLADTYYAECDIKTKEIKSSFILYTGDILQNISYDRVRFEITQSEYESNIIPIAKIDAAIAAKIELQKDINEINKLEKAGFLVIMDYLRSLGLSKTNLKFKADVKTKYEGL